MTRKIIVLLLIVTAASLTVASSAFCEFGPRFGPWKYYAPYYFPREGCLGICFSPKDYIPTYEDPNPLVPGLPTPIPPPRKVGKVKPPRFQAMRRGRGPARPLPPLPPAQPVPSNNPFYQGSSSTAPNTPPAGQSAPMGSPMPQQ